MTTTISTGDGIGQLAPAEWSEMQNCWALGGKKCLARLRVFTASASGEAWEALAEYSWAKSDILLDSVLAHAQQRRYLELATIAQVGRTDIDIWFELYLPMRRHQFLAWRPGHSMQWVEYGQTAKEVAYAS